MLDKLYALTLNVNRRTLAGRATFKLLRKLIATAAPAGTTVRYTLDGYDLAFPILHDAPHTWTIEPDYSKSLGRVAAAVGRRWPEATIVDVGANVGDSAAIIRGAGAKNPILSIEGVDAFFSVLQQNAATLDIRPLKAFVGTRAETKRTTTVVSDRGNAVIASDEGALGGVETEFSPLPVLVAKAGVPRPVKLIKTDIEGFDLPVLDASAELIRIDKPVLFFELHVSDDDERRFSIGWQSFFAARRAEGYARAYYWLNSRDYLGSIALSDEMGLEAIHSHLLNRNGVVYADVCLVHGDDTDLIVEIHKTELQKSRERS